jgi:ABC-type nickel/cobalt efflux system permease component RcnA
MDQSFLILLATTISVAFIHTLIGPDHYVPFIALSKARNWSMPKTIAITATCGLGHILSGVALGLLAASVEGILSRIEIIESVRGGIAAWLLTAFGFVYCVWGIRMASQNRTHSHFHDHGDGTPHDHAHDHHRDHAHPHGAGGREITPWVLFVIFVFGPCEPLIPLIMYPATQNSLARVLFVTITFGAITIAAMIGVVVTSTFGLKKIACVPFVERYGNALAGGMICSCGLAISFLGL